MARPVSNTWTEKSVAQAIQDCARDICEDGKWSLRITQYQQWAKGRVNAPTKHVIYDLFGTWPEACKAAGLNLLSANVPVFTPERIDKSVRAAVLRHRKDSGESPMLEGDYDRMYRDPKIPKVDVSPAVVIRYCGRWSEAAEKYGFAVGRVKSLTDRPVDEWVAEISEICEEQGGPLSIRAFNQCRPPGFPSSRRLATAFGGWESLLSKAGYTSYSGRPSKTVELAV
jgi:hypothetical protein